MDQQFFAQEIAIVAFICEEQTRFADRYCQEIRHGVVKHTRDNLDGGDILMPDIDIPTLKRF